MNKATTLILVAMLGLAACRGTQSNDAPIHLNLNMDFQERFDPQEANPFFADNRAMRPLVPGTVARGMLREDVVFYEGRTEAGGFVDQMPVPTTRELLDRGRERFNIFCAPCHGEVGDGEGIITTGGFGYTPAPTFHSDRLRQMQDGYIYGVIAQGIRTMPAYGHQVPPADRWAIVAYVRALQRSQNARPDDVPANIRADISQTAGAAAPPDEAATGGDETGASAGVDDTTATGGNE